MKRLPLGPLMVDLAATTLATAERALLQHATVGGVILFTRNYESPAQLRQLTAEIKALRAPALLIAVDQEGGRIQRFTDGFTRFPAAHSFGAFDDARDGAHDDTTTGADLAQAAGYLMAAELRAVGVDFSFAPVLDRADLASTVIGDRAFHHDPHTLLRLAHAYITGMHAAGMVAIGKHFPGHGGVIADSHHELPIDPRPAADLAPDLLPYRRLARHLAGVMTAHVQFPNITPVVPTFSRYWLETVLRQHIGFRGAIFSDDLSMRGAHAVGGLQTRVQMALQAGCDMAIVCNAGPAALAQLIARMPAPATIPLSPNHATRLAGLRPHPAPIRQPSNS